ncbi:MAG: hypothetical protein GY928_04770 [Colwellia sp.]|nr:hypothetical protein [Colwellia sp.]
MKNKVLFLDDDKYEMLGLVDRLQFDGFDVTYCTYPSNAIDLLKNGYKPDLIISDLLMRNDISETVVKMHHTGINFIDIARNELKLQCPIIVLSVVTKEATLAELKPYNVRFYSKPITPRELSMVVNEQIIGK